MPDWLRAFRAAWTFLTRIPVGGFPYPPRTWAWITIWFPLVGLVLGGLEAGVWAICGGLPEVPRVLVAVTFGLLLTGGFHEDGLSDTFDALGGGYDRQAVLRILKDSRIGAFGALALGSALALRVSLLVALGPQAPVGFVLGHSLSRALPVVQLGVQPYARRDDPKSRSVDVARSGGVQALIALAWAAAIGASAVLWGISFGRMVSMFVVMAIIGVGFGLHVQRRVGGLTGDFLGALQQMALLAILAVLAWGSMA